MHSKWGGLLSFTAPPVMGEGALRPIYLFAVAFCLLMCLYLWCWGGGRGEARPAPPSERGVGGSRPPQRERAKGAWRGRGLPEVARKGGGASSHRERERGGRGLPSGGRRCFPSERAKGAWRGRGLPSGGREEALPFRESESEGGVVWAWPPRGEGAGAGTRGVAWLAGGRRERAGRPPCWAARVGGGCHPQPEAAALLLLLLRRSEPSSGATQEGCGGAEPGPQVRDSRGGGSSPSPSEAGACLLARVGGVRSGGGAAGRACLGLMEGGGALVGLGGHCLCQVGVLHGGLGGLTWA